MSALDADPAAIEAAWHEAASRQREAVRAIVANPAPPDFDNTILALERAGSELQRVFALYRCRASTTAGTAMQRLAPLHVALEDEIAHDAALFARIQAVPTATLDADQKRLTEMLRRRAERRGAALGEAARTRLAAINARVAACQATFEQNLLADQQGQNTRPAVMAVLTASPDRAERERVWRQWNARGDNAGPHDNKPVIAEILRLRGEKARLFGYNNFAEFACADRMARTPDRAMALLRDVWDRVRPITEAHLAELQRLAADDGVEELAPWDRYFYAERLRRERFGFDAASVRPHLQLDNVVAAIFDAASRLHGLRFVADPAAPVQHESVRAYAVERGGERIGLLYLDLLARPDKQRGSWQAELQPFDDGALPVSMIVSGIEPGTPALMGWEYANVLFHEMGHALHMLLGCAPYPSIGSMAVAWDMIELPALLNERWLLDRDLLRTHLRLPDALFDGLEAASRHDRVFSVTLDYLAAAIVDLRIHLAADGSEVDAVAIERAVLDELGMPEAVDLTMRVPHFHHAFTDVYAAGVYSYLWADVMAADVAEAFVEAPGGLYDGAVAARFRDTILTVGNRVPAADAFRAFRGRDPDPVALLRRFGMDA